MSISSLSSPPTNRESVISSSSSSSSSSDLRKEPLLFLNEETSFAILRAAMWASSECFLDSAVKKFCLASACSYNFGSTFGLSAFVCSLKLFVIPIESFGGGASISSGIRTLPLFGRREGICCCGSSTKPSNAKETRLNETESKSLSDALREVVGWVFSKLCTCASLVKELSELLL